MCLCSGSADGKHPAKVLLLHCHFGSFSAMNKDLIRAAVFVRRWLYPSGICRQPHFLLPVPSWLNPEQPLSGRVNVVAWWWVSATYLVWRQEKACLSVPLPADMLQICSSAALSALRKVQCWVCLAVSLDTALDSLMSKEFPFVWKRNVFWRAQYAAEVSRHDRRVSRLPGVLIACHRGNHTLIFH